MYGVHMLKRNNLLGLLAVGICFIFAGCCEKKAEAYYPIGFSISQVDGYTITRTNDGTFIKIESDCSLIINTGLYNDDISDEVLDEAHHSGMDTDFWFKNLKNGSFKSNSYEGINLDDFGDELTNGTGKFYAVINDPKLDDYHSDYETVTIYYKSSNFIEDIAIHKKSE